MKTATKLMVTAATVGTLAVSGQGIAGADPDAQSTINQYQSQGYQVVLERSGNLPTNKCTVTSVRNGQPVYRTEYQRTLMPNGKWISQPVQVLDHRLIFISLNCNP